MAVVTKVGTVVVSWVDKWHQHIMIPTTNPLEVFEALTKYKLLKEGDSVVMHMVENGQTHIMVKRNVSRVKITQVTMREAMEDCHQYGNQDDK